MANINLYDAHQERLKKSERSSLGFLIFSAACIVIALGGYGVLLFLANAKDAKIVDLKDQTERMRQSLSATSGETDEMHDIFLRLEELKKSDSGSVSSRFLGEVQKEMVNGALLSQFSYDREKNVIIVGGDAIDFTVLLQQMKRLRNNSSFSSAALASTGISDSGYILFSIELKISSKTIQ